MIRWRFVIHGGIDGHSRCITFLHCSTNNEAYTVYTLFIESIASFRCPLRIRTDHGTENIQVARWMLEHYGTASNTVLTGLSAHNQCIERLWVDVYRYVSEHFINLFYYMESVSLLDINNESHLICLALCFPTKNIQLPKHVLSTMEQSPG